MAGANLYSRRETSQVDQDEQIQEVEVTEIKEKLPLCEICVREGPSVNSVAVFFCFRCEVYVCVNCLPGHESHEGMKVGRKESDREMERDSRESERMDEENERKLSDLLDDLMKEENAERIKKFESSHVGIYDRVNLKHELDQTKDCWTRGLCVLENQRWVACDCDNDCIKIFTLGSNVVQRYIRCLGIMPKPWDVTEILVNQNSTEPNLVSGRTSEASVTDRAAPDKQCLIAVTFLFQSQIIFIDLGRKPAKTHKIIHTEGLCWSLHFYDDKIFTICGDIDSPYSVYIISTDGVTINKFDIGFYSFLPGPSLAVVSGRVYTTDNDNHKVQCRNVEGQVISEITIKESKPVGISVDLDNNVYVCAQGHNKIYKLDPDLTRYKSVLDQTADYIDMPRALCYYRGKLFISHGGSTSLHNYVTVVGLL